MGSSLLGDDLYEKSKALAVTHGLVSEFQVLPRAQAVMLVALHIHEKQTQASAIVLGKALIAVKPKGMIPYLSDELGFQKWVRDVRFGNRPGKAALIHPGKVFNKPGGDRPYYMHPEGLCAVCEAMYKCVNSGGPSKMFTDMHRLGLIWLHNDVPAEFLAPKSDEPPKPVSPPPSEHADSDSDIAESDHCVATEEDGDVSYEPQEVVPEPTTSKGNKVDKTYNKVPPPPQTSDSPLSSSTVQAMIKDAVAEVMQATSAPKSVRGVKRKLPNERKQHVFATAPRSVYRPRKFNVGRFQGRRN